MEFDSKKQEELLVSRLIDDDKEAYAELYQIYKDRIIYFVLKFTKSKEIAEDVAHDTLTVIWTNRHFIDTQLSFSSFIFTIAKNRILYLMRNQESERKIQEAIFSKAIDFHEDTENTLTLNELKNILLIAISKLTKRQKEVFLLSREKGLTQREIANELGISISAVQKHIAEALRIIQVTLRTHYGSYSSLILLSTILFS